MDLIKFLVENNRKNTCFLCCTQTKTTIEADEVLEIHRNRDLSCTVSLSEMVEELFPLHEILTNRACEDCSNTIIHIYIIMQKNKLYKQELSTAVDNIDKQINKKLILVSKGKSKKCMVRIKIPMHNQKKTKQTEIIHHENEQHSDFCTQDNEKFTENSFKCNKCTMSFSNEKLLQKHKRLGHNVSNTGVVCEVCGKVCRTPHSLKSHLKGHNEKPCPYCGIILKAHAHFRIHVKNHKSNSKTKSRNTIYKCNDCYYKSLNKKSLEAHINKTHLKLRPFVCEYCFKGFYKKSTLTEHSKVHLSNKTDTCEVCGDSFVNKKCLIEHLRLHTGEKPYECEICGDKFVSASRKSEHIKRKHSEKAEICNICGKKYSLKKDLNRHVKNIHKKEDFQNDVLNIPDVNFQNYDVYDLPHYV